jgi:Lrp/AsnC family transcriptional regulator
MIMDRTDRHILSLLQKDATVTVAEMASRIGLSPSSCWKRVQRLEASGAIERRVALLSPAKVGCGVSAYISIQAREHSADQQTSLAQIVDGMPEIVECYRLAGNIDYLLRLRVPDIAAYDAVYKKLTAVLSMHVVSGSFVLEEIKATTAVPLYLTSEREHAFSSNGTPLSSESD